MDEEIVNLNVGDDAPNFSGLDQNGKTISNRNMTGERYILYFYPKDDTPGCTTQACDFRDNLQIFSKRGLKVIGISKDDAESHKRFIKKYDLTFPLLIDQDLKIHKMFGVWREKKNYGKTYMGVSRSTFVIDEKGKIEWLGYNVRAKGHVDKLIKELKI
tara:strand:+ start:27 stop:503 length:477 start_codon:yes stop_codon:yes gene_type:complete